MNRFLCSFATIVAVVNGYAIGGGQYGGSSGSGAVIGGRAYQILPAISQQTIAGASSSNSGYGASTGGYGAGYGGSSGGYGSSSSIDISSLLLAAGGHLSPQQLAQLALSLPSDESPLIDTTGLSSYSGSASYGAPSGGNLAYAIAPGAQSNSPAPAHSYSAPAPAPAQIVYQAPAPAPAPAQIVYQAPAPAPAPHHAPAPAPAPHHAPAPAPAPHHAPAPAPAPAAAHYPSAAAAASYIAGNSVAAAPASAPASAGAY